MSSSDHGAFPSADLKRLLDLLGAQGHRVVGPTLRDGAVVWDTIARVSDLPIGWRDHQEPGRYRLEQTGTGEIFGIVHGPQSLKPFAFAPREPLLQIERTNGGLSIYPRLPKPEKIALLGARPCDVAGLAIQDQIFLRGPYRDSPYASRREGLFVIAVNCTRVLPTCFCSSMKTGPRAQNGFDLALTELDDVLLIEAGSEAGKAVLTELPVSPASETLLAEASKRIGACAESQGRLQEQAALPQALYDAYDHPRWDDVAARCLACTNCTMVCPTCFCHTIEDAPTLDGQHTERTRLWDSCFTHEHGYIHGKNIRPMIKDRYRMWLTHKFAAWHDQFGMSGCVGCGRCITWCPVGIDVREELSALLASDGRSAARRSDNP
ncbi:4Fe-4S dicluster domain-containing protein [Candidatus Nitrospira inopinata]|uniref:Sulfhydrogenase, subunit beta n=1 Tax=Candidatus Nitrospira inopinata TaxID=1715989 RepID=A0A0S4KM91_9BACT|nr:4Fe-4S dicluster domain-containing protein [Candidatus Nitrospira inopinata]CUQ65564.1 Sulfhydrogenase, subunit beta [Candidatus Nitrospira inopinata]